jgi:hypothetical protein
MMSARSFQLGIALAPSLPHFVHRIHGPKDGTGISSGQLSTLTSVWYPQALQVTSSPRTLFWRMLPSVIGRIGSSSLPYFQAKNRQGTKSSAPAQFGSRNETNPLSGYDLGGLQRGSL